MRITHGYKGCFGEDRCTHTDIRIYIYISMYTFTCSSISFCLSLSLSLSRLCVGTLGFRPTALRR